MQPPDAGQHTTYSVVECDAVGCRDDADYQVRSTWASDDWIVLYVCLVHMPWALKELRAYRIAGEPPAAVEQTPLVGPR